MSIVTIQHTSAQDQHRSRTGVPVQHISHPTASPRGRPRTWAALDLPGAYDSLVEERNGLAARLDEDSHRLHIGGDRAASSQYALFDPADQLGSDSDYTAVIPHYQPQPTYSQAVRVKRVDCIPIPSARHAHAPKIGSPLGKTVTIRYPSGSSTMSGESEVHDQEQDLSPTPDHRRAATTLRSTQINPKDNTVTIAPSDLCGSRKKEKTLPVAVVISNLPSSTIRPDITRILADIGIAPHGGILLGGTVDGLCTAMVPLIDDMAAYEVVESLHGYIVDGRHLTVQLQKMPLEITKSDKLSIHGIVSSTSTQPAFVEEPSTSNTAYHRENIVYASNVPYSMKKEELMLIFSSIPALSADLVLTRGGLSTGRGRVNFATCAEAKEAVSQFHGMLVRGRPLRLQQAGTTTTPGRQSSPPYPCPPLPSSNVPQLMAQAPTPRPLPPPPSTARERLNPNAPVWVKLHGVLQPLPFVPPTSGPIRMPIPTIRDPHTSSIRAVSTDLLIPSGTPPLRISTHLDPSRPAFRPSGVSRGASWVTEPPSPEPRDCSVSPTDTSSSEGTPLTPPPYTYRMTAHGPVLCGSASALPPSKPETELAKKVDEDEPIRSGVVYKDTPHGRVLCVEEPIFDEACLADTSLSSEDDSVVIIIDSELDWESLPPPQTMPASDTFGFCTTPGVIDPDVTSSGRLTSTPSALSRLQVYQPPSLRYKGQIYHRAVSSPAATPSRPPTILVARKTPATPLLVTRAHFEHVLQHSLARPQISTITSISSQTLRSKKPFADLSPSSPSSNARILPERCVSSPSNGTVQEKTTPSPLISDITRSPSQTTATPLGASRSGNSTVDLFSESLKVPASPKLGERARKVISRTKRHVSHGAARYSENVSPI